MSRVSPVVLLLLAACAREPRSVSASATSPHEVSVNGALHAVQCGDVTAVFTGSDPRQLPPGTPPSFATEGLAFRFGEGAPVGFTPPGQLFFSDWSFDVFSPDCAWVALQVDHYGPVHVVARERLRQYLGGALDGGVAYQVKAPAAGDAPVLGQVSWVGPTALEVVASSNGGAEVLRATLTPTFEVKTVFHADTAPRGLARTDGGYQVKP